jgi:hypothetical protein
MAMLLSGVRLASSHRQTGRSHRYCPRLTRTPQHPSGSVLWHIAQRREFMSSFGVRGCKQIIAGIEGLASTPASQAPIRPNGVPDKIKTPQVIESEATQLIVKMDQLRASSARAISDLPLQPSAPSIAAGAPKPTTAPAQIKRIENWAVME